MPEIRKLEQDWQDGEDHRGELWRYRDLSGEHLGVRLEELVPGASSSEHHYHTTEEEHVIALEGAAELILGDESHEFVAGDHVWFEAGIEVPHHFRNNTDEPFRYLVFGERKAEDVVVYPEHQVMMVKALDFRQVTYRTIKRDS